MDEYYVVTAYEDGIPVVATLSSAGIGEGIDASVDINTIVTRLTEIRDGGGGITQAGVRDAIDASTDINAIVSLLAAIYSDRLTQAQIEAAINSAADINTLITQLTAAADSASSINGKIPSPDPNGQLPVSERVTSYDQGEVQTAATGSSWTALPSGATRNVTLRNRTGTSIDFRKVGSSTFFTMQNETDEAVPVLANSSEWEIKRTDNSNTRVIVKFLRYA